MSNSIKTINLKEDQNNDSQMLESNSHKKEPKTNEVSFSNERSSIHNGKKFIKRFSNQNLKTASQFNIRSMQNVKMK